MPSESWRSVLLLPVPPSRQDVAGAARLDGCSSACLARAVYVATSGPEGSNYLARVRELERLLIVASELREAVRLARFELLLVCGEPQPAIERAISLLQQL